MVHSPKHISHTTNIKLEPYSVVTDISTADTDYASIASNDSFYNNPYLLNGQPVFGPWPKHTLPTKSYSESSHLHQFIENGMKQNSSVTTTHTAVHCGKPSEEISMAPIKIPVTGKYGINKQKLSENNLHEKTVALLHEPMKKFGTKIETTGESSTDQDLEINEIDNTKVKATETMPIVTLQSMAQSIKSNEIHDKIGNKSVMHNSRYNQREYTTDLLATASVPSITMKTRKMMNATYRTAISQKDIYLKNSSEEDLLRENYTNELMHGIGKVLRRGDGGIAALYKNDLERCVMPGTCGGAWSFIGFRAVLGRCSG